MFRNSSQWHNLTPGDRTPEFVNGVIEIQKGAKAGYELSNTDVMLKLNRVLFSSYFYPANYGFIPKTYCPNKGPLKIIILSQIGIVPLCIVNAKIIGVMRMIAIDEIDDKIISVATGDPSVNNINDISELPVHFITELKNFFENYEMFEDKTKVVAEFLDRNQAKKILQESFNLYKSRFEK